MRTIKFQMLICCICSILVLTSCYGNSGNHSEKYTKEEQTTDHIIKDYVSGEENLNGNSCENLRNEALAAQQGEWIYFGKKGLYKLNVNTGEKITLSQDISISRISVCKDWIYYRTDIAPIEGIFRIRTDGKISELIVEDIGNIDTRYFFENEYLYYATDEQDKKVFRIDTNSPTETYTVYDIKDNETFEGVYKGYIVIRKENSIKLIDVNTQEASEYNWNGLNHKLHFDENGIICIAEHGGNVSIFDMQTKQIRTEEFYSKLQVENVTDGNYYFYVSMPDFGRVSHVFGYTMLSLIDGDNTRFMELNDDMPLSVTVLDDWIYYGTGETMYSYDIANIVRIDKYGNNWELVWSE